MRIIDYSAFAAAYFRKGGFNDIRIETEGYKGIEMALEMKRDLIIADLGISRKNAFEVINELRNDIPNKLPALLIVSGHNITEDSLLEAGLTLKNFVKKPFSKSEISNFIRRRM